MAKSEMYYIEVLGKSLATLEVFVTAGRPSLSLHEISALTGLNKNTVFRILHTLAEHGYVVKRNRTYELGPRLHDLSHAKLRRRALLAVAGPVMEALQERFRETVSLGVLDGGQVRYVDVRESPEPFRLAERVGGAADAHCTALGKCHLAWMGFEEVKALLRERGLPRRTPATITAFADLKRELERTRRRGYAVDREESTAGAICVAAPVLDARGVPCAALSISGPATRITEAVAEEAGDALVRAAAEVRSRME